MISLTGETPMNKNLEILEFHKILEMLANLSANGDHP